FSADARRLTTLSDNVTVRIWDAATGKELQKFLVPAEAQARQNVISPDGKTWASGARDVVLWDAATGKKRQIWVGEEGIQTGALAFAADGATLYSWNYLGRDGKVCLWDVRRCEKLGEFATDRTVRCLMGSFSPNGQWFAFGGDGPALLLYDMATGTVAHRIEIPEMRYNNRSLAISPDSRMLAVGDEQGTLHRLELASGKFRRRLLGGHQGCISALLFSPDGKRLISGSKDTTALVWDLTGRLHGPRKPLGAAELDACWTDLAGDDAERAYQSISPLAGSPGETIPFLGKHLQPASGVETRQVDRQRWSPSPERLRNLR